MIKQFLYLCSILFLAVTLSGCASTQPAGEDSDVRRPGREQQTGGIPLRDLFRNITGKNKKGERGRAASSDPGYQEYLEWKEWQEFQEYKKWKAEQGEDVGTN